MRSVRTTRTVAVAALAGALTLSGVLAAQAAPAKKPDPFKVGIVTCKTGAFAAYGDAYIEGWNAGLKWVNSKKLTNGRKIQVVGVIDDTTSNSETAAAGFRTLVGQGAKVIMGSCSSAVASNLAALAVQNNVIYMPGPAAADTLSGINRNTFRTGRQSLQDVQAALTYLSDVRSARIVTFAENYIFGQGNAAAVNLVLKDKGATLLDPVLVPLDAADGTTYAKKVKDENADFVWVAWSGAATKVNPWTSLKQQGVLDTADVITGLANYATWDATGSVVGTDVKYISHYFGGAAGTAEEKFMLNELAKRMKKPDLFNPDGFNAAMMVAQLAKADPSKDRVTRMISSLENHSFKSVKGLMTVRTADHALIQPMFRAALVRVGRSYTPVKIGVSNGVAPPVTVASPWTK
jgi:branched-chain amino acid transport system substrate-binding protein